MKKITISILFLATLFSVTSFAQGDAKFRFGLKFQPAVTWFKPGDLKSITNDGSAIKFGYGLVTEFRLNKVVSFATGLEFSQLGGKLNYEDSVYYFSEEEQVNFIVENRKFTMNYIEIPIALKMKTPEIGSMTYFAQFGFNANIRWNGKATDEGIMLSTPVINKKTDSYDITKDVSFAKMGLIVGIGCEWNLAGSTSLLFGVNFQNGFTNTLTSTSKQLFNYAKNDIETNAPVSKFKQDIKSKLISITVGVLF